MKINVIFSSDKGKLIILGCVVYIYNLRKFYILFNLSEDKNRIYFYIWDYGFFEFYLCKRFIDCRLIIFN